MNHIELFGKVIEISHSNLEISSRIKSILNILAQDLGFEEVMVYTLDQDKRLTCRFMNDKSALFKVLSKYRCHVGEGIVGSVAQRRAPQYYTARDVPPRFGCLFYPDLDGLSGKLRTFAFLPLADDSYIHGVLVAISSRDMIEDPEKLLLSILTREIGGVLRTYSLILGSKKRISELATLSELGKVLTSDVEPQEMLKTIALIIAKALNARFVTIKLEYPFLRLASQRFTHGAIDVQTMAQVNDLEVESVKGKKSLSLKDRLPEAQESVLKFFLHTSPMLSKNRIIGTITMGATKAQQYFVAEEDGRSLINTISNYMSNGLENTLLNRRLRDVVRELSDAQKRLIEQEKLKSLGEMTANIAHEIKNPLVIIGGFTKRLAKKAVLDGPENRYVEIILKEVTRLEAILNEILNYVKEGPVLTGTCDVNATLEEVLSLLTPDSSWRDIKVEKKYGENLPLVTCDSQQIKQVLINILINAFEAMNGSGKVRIETQQTVVDGKTFLSTSISDTGGGVDPSIMDNIFNPFFTTKERGTGLGLAISNKIVMNHNGRLDIKNEAGKGVTFVMYLPIQNNIITEEFL
jgi:signal transduction histidine kinase